ncbi:RND transporter [Edaphobacter acidisoli]|uniref:RND transporter n=1 Tax=Edaphobacter acidisoli TaxID=2040573 RepID=A0A916S3X3_9BACT|nr:efflux RND transporter permease subunit [Edaphobacter acidisoli]GGA80008.1 RND transporter [Edaphobacter acidisoli]
MWLVHAALRRPITVLVAVIAVALCSVLALTRMPVDIFPNLNLPVIYVAQPYGGMSPAQMEGYLTYYYESNFLYISGLESVESKSVENFALLKLSFRPGTDMNQALSQTVAYIERAHAYMPAGTVPPFVLRFDAGSVPVGYVTFFSKTHSVDELQDLALNRVRPLFTTLPGVSSPATFGGSSRTIVIKVDRDKLNSYRMSTGEVVKALLSGNVIAPSGDVKVGDLDRITPMNGVVSDIRSLADLPIRTGSGPTVFVRDIGTVEDGSDLTLGYALVNGRRTVYLPVTKRADASTLDVVNEVKASMGRFANVLPPDVQVSYEFDQSGRVRRSLASLIWEGVIGAVLTGLMVFLFLREWRSSFIVVASIPFALIAAVVGLWLAGQTINIMTLSGLALAVGILVDEAMVEIENIHRNLQITDNIPQAVLDGTRETMIPRLLAMLSILAVFVPSFLMVGVTRALFIPLSLAVGFTMLASYLLSSTFVPVLYIWLNRSMHRSVEESTGRSRFDHFRDRYTHLVQRLLGRRKTIVAIYLVGAAVILALAIPKLGREIFPHAPETQFQLRLRAPAGTRIEVTEQIALKTLDEIKRIAGPENVEISLGYVGTYAPSYPVNLVYLWTSGPQEAVLRIQLRKSARIHIQQLEEELRPVLARDFPGTAVTFESADIVDQIMDFGSPTPIEVAIQGFDLSTDHAYAERVRAELGKLDHLRDLHYAQPLEYPSLNVDIDRVRAGQLGLTVEDVARSVETATWSSRFVSRNFWQDPSTGVGYQVQVEVPQGEMKSIDDLANVPLMNGGSSNHPNVGDVANLSYGQVTGEFDRYDMQRMISLTANAVGEDLGSAASQVEQALQRAGAPPRGVEVQIRGQVTPLRQTMHYLTLGLLIAVVAIYLLLAANFQSLRLALVSVSTAPAVICGVALMLLMTGTTLNLQSFMGAIMALGVSVANSILLVTFAEEHRRQGDFSSVDAAVFGGGTRLRPIVMTSIAMIAGMVPMALGLSEGGRQVAPLGRAVIGGLMASTIATLLILPAVYSAAQERASKASASLDVTDQHSPYASL